MSELLLIIVVALIVLPPQKWQMVLYHLAKIIRWCQSLKETFYEFCKTHIQTYELETNQQRAKEVDARYKQPEKKDS